MEVLSHVNVLLNLSNEALYSKCMLYLIFTHFAYSGAKLSSQQSPPESLKTPHSNFRTVLLLFVAHVGETMGE